MASPLEVSRSKDMLQPLWIYGRYILIPFNFSRNKSQVDFKRNHEPSPREYKPLQYLLEQLYRELASTQDNQMMRCNQNQFLSVYTTKKFQDMQGILLQRSCSMSASRAWCYTFKGLQTAIFWCSLVDSEIIHIFIHFLYLFHFDCTRL